MIGIDFAIEVVFIGECRLAKNFKCKLALFGVDFSDIKKTLMRTAVKTGLSKPSTDMKKTKYEPNTMPARATPVRARAPLIERTFTPPRAASEEAVERDTEGK